MEEISGVVVSGDTFWVHNDSGNPSIVFHLDQSGKVIGTVHLDVRAKDWEDLAAQKTDAGRLLFYVGDTGDNLEIRKDGIVVHVFEEPSSPVKTAKLTPQSFKLHYPDHPRDAEALLIDQRFQELLVITKPRGGWPEVFVAPLPLRSDTQLRFAIRLDPSLTTVPLHFVTAADLSADGSWIVLRTYTGLYLFRRLPEMRIFEALSTQPCDLPAPDEPQGEAVAFGESESSGTPPPIFTLSEGRPTRIFRIQAVTTVQPKTDKP